MDYYIAPETDIYVLTGVPLDNTYEHTIAWPYGNDSRQRQAQYFLSKQKYHFDNCTYERRERLWCKVEQKADNMYDCNYMMFRNTAFGNKWFYAFIISVEYVNNNNTRIAFEIDVMQTWLRGINLDYNPEPCFVERSHTATDNMFEHLVPEEIVSTDEYLVDQEINFDMNDMVLMMCASEMIEGDEFVPPTGMYIDGVFGAIQYWIFECRTNAQIDHVMDIIGLYIKAGKENSILNLQMVPRKFAYDTNDSPVTVKLTQPTPGLMIGGKNSGFFPKNNKLYSYPFCRIRVNNQAGTVKEYKWELFDYPKQRGYFRCLGTYAWQAGAIAYPEGYKGVWRNMEDAVTMENFPICPWASDAYKAWWAQNKASHILSGIGIATSIGAAAVGGFTGNPQLLATGVGGTYSSLTQVISSLYDAKHRSPNAYGLTNSNVLLAVTDNYRFTFTRESLRPEMLRMYDSFFTKFGYARKLVTSPPYLNRERWTYVKTVGFEVNGKINNEDSKKIAEIYDKGITFWRNGDELGRYELSNKPLPQV